MYMIEHNYNQNATYQHYRDSYGNQVTDACDAAASGNTGGLTNGEYADFKSQCSTAHTLEVLQWVFLGVAVASAGAGTFVLLNESGSAERAQARLKARRFAFEPLVDRRSLALQATLRFE
jgi:hypothetical protein